MEYLKVWTSFRETISVLDDSEKGRLFDAMLLYAKTGEEPQGFQGNERFLWIAAKQDIDRTAQRCEALRANASKGGLAKSRNKQALANDSNSKQTLANDSKDYQALANDSKLEQTEANVSCNIKKSNVKKSKENILFARFWEVYPRHEAKSIALKAFEKLNPDEELVETMLQAIERQKQTAQWQENNGQFIPHPATWLNQHRWEDEVKKAPAGKVIPVQQFTQRDYSNAQDEAMQRMIESMVSG